MTVANFQATNEASYDVVVTNTAGAVTSAVARVYLDAPLRFVECGMDAGNGFTGVLVGAGDTNYVIEASTNLADWVDLATNSSPNGIVDFVDTTVARFELRFYRAR